MLARSRSKYCHSEQAPAQAEVLIVRQTHVFGSSVLPRNALELLFFRCRWHINGSWDLIWPCRQVVVRKIIEIETPEPSWKHTIYELGRNDCVVPLEDSGDLDRVVRLDSGHNFTEM